MEDSVCSNVPSLEWEGGKSKKFRDPVHGYITVPKIYVTGIIDTPYMQRIKEISQTGIYPLYPSATHNRFAHSLGVYHFSMMIYKNLKERILSNMREIEGHLKKEEVDSLKCDLNFWEVLLSIAALLHDVGHPAFSHSFEFLYDDIFMIFPDGECPAGIDRKYEDLFSSDHINMRESKKTYKQWQAFNEELQSKFEELQDKQMNNRPSYESSWLKKKLYKYFNVPDENIMDVKDIKGNPHERMSAYMILSGMEVKRVKSMSLLIYKRALKHICQLEKRVKRMPIYKITLKHIYQLVKNVKRTNKMRKYAKKAIEGKKENISLYDYITKVIETYLTCHKQPVIAAKINESIRFICRMITGQLYETPYKSEFCFINYRKSIKNCIIKIINGTIDADNIDYTMRNSYTAGYDTHKVDYNRLCQAFSIYFEENILKSCFSSSSISVLEGFISARNAEPTWLYSHHKVVYHDVLLKMLFIYSSRYLSYLDAKYHKLPPPKEIKRGGDILKIEASGIVKTCLSNPDKEEPCTARYRPHGIYMISPLIPYLGSKHIINSTTDATFNTLFRSLNVELPEIKPKLKSLNNKQYEPLYSTTHNDIFISLINEYISHRYKRSLWKSYPEYLVLIKSAAKELGISWATANNYMMELIEVYMNKLSFCSLYDKEVGGEHPIEPYEDQYIYRFNDGIESSPEEFKDDCFSYPRCVCKVVNVRNKDFNDLIVDFDNGSRQKLSDFPHSINWGVPYKFPYFFIECEKDKLDGIKKAFWNGFNEYCLKKREREKSMASMGEGISLKKTRGFRDVIHGDIVFHDKFWKIIETQEFQRLLRIKQLALTSLVFPTVNHTRYEHSIGACHIMCQVVDHFKTLDLNLKIDADDSDIAILATLLHDIGHGPFSHAFERVMDVHHEEWTKRIILESLELNNAIKEGFGPEAPQRVVDCLNYKDSVKITSPEKLNFSFIYSALVNGALDVDRLDYLSRDAYYTATKFGNIDIPKIISAIKLTSINGVYRLCFDQACLPYLEQMIFARKEMYNNVYCDPRKVLMETLVEKIIQRAYKIRDKLNESDRRLLENFKEPVRMDVSEYLLLDDYTMYECFKKWHKEVKDPILSMLTGSVLNKNLYENALDVSVGSNVHADLLKEIGSLFGLDPKWYDSPNDTVPEESFAIFRMDKSVIIYPDAGIENDIGKTIIVSNQNGEIEDFGKLIHFNSTEISWHYLFWSEEVLREAIKGKYTKKNADEMVEQMKQLLESYKPRNHIEIERKYLCSDKVLKLVESLLSEKPDAKDDDPFILSEPFNEKEQIDTYFDTKDQMLLRKGCTLRIRRLENNNYVCTVKLPIESISFGGNSPTARREYESASSSNLDDPIELLKAQKIFILKRLGSKGITTNKDFDSLEPVLNVKNNRKKGTVKKTDSNFKCEVCLDRVIYSSPDGVKKSSDYQIEIELKSDYLTHVILNQFTVKLEEMLRKEFDNFKPTETSKLVRGLSQLGNTNQK